LYLALVFVQLKGFEAIRGVTLDAEQFSVDNDCLTPTFKFKRPQLQKRYQVSLQHESRSVHTPF
jgi:long-chain acyl-CoA synthetase